MVRQERKEKEKVNEIGREWLSETTACETRKHLTNIKCDICKRNTYTELCLEIG